MIMMASDATDIEAAVAQAVLAGRADAVVAADRDGNIVFGNPGAERIFGYAADEAVGRSLDLIVPERQRARHWEGYRRVIAGGQSRYGDGDLLAVPAIRKDGSTVSVEFTIQPLPGEGGAPGGFVAVLRDVTARFEEMRALRRRLTEAARDPAS